MATSDRPNGVLFRRTMAVVSIALTCLASPITTDSASAQEVTRRANLFERLFGLRRQPPPAIEPQYTPREQRRPRRPRQSAPSRLQAAPAPAKPVVEKLTDAKVVLVVGDFLAGGVAGGLAAAYEEVPGVRVEDRSKGSSGFVRTDYYNWNAEITPIIEEVKPAAIVVMMGSNDRQQISIGSQTFRPQTEAWTEEYTKRVAAFAETLKQSNTPFLWVGLPPFKSPAMTSDMLVFNDIQKKAAETAGGTFIDIWDGFVDENGAFIFTGPDMNGQPVRLRSSDGINLTREARRKIAFYLEKPLAQILGAAAAPATTPGLADGEPGIPSTEPVAVSITPPKDLTRTPPISLAGPDLSTNGALLGGETPAAAAVPAHSRFKPQPGRADYLLNGGAPKTDGAGDSRSPAP